MLLTSIRAKIFASVTLIVTVVAGLVVTSSYRAVEPAMVGGEERAVRNALALIEENVRGRYRTLLKDKVLTIQARKAQLRAFDRMVVATLDRFAALADHGLVDDAQAKALAQEWLARAAPIDGGHVLAFDAADRVVAHPDPAMLAVDIGGLTDFKGRRLTEAARDEAARYGDTFLTYDWERAAAKQYGHFLLYPRWGWVVASVGDIGAVENQVRTQLAVLEEELRDTLPRIRMAGGGFVFLFDGTGRVIVPPTAAAETMTAPVVLERLRRLAAEGGGDAVAELEDGGARLQARAIHIKPLDWYVAAIASRDALQAPARALVREQAVIFAGVLAGGLLLAFALAHSLAQPLNRLAAYARTLPETDFTRERRDTDLSAQLPTTRRDEIGRLARAFVFMDESLHRNVRALMEEVSARQHIEGELKVAHDIQMGLLPKGFADDPRLQLSGLLEPAKEVGGDLFDHFFLDADRLCFTIGDVAGKGVPAALFMAIAKTLIKAAAERDAEPAAIMDKVNDELSRDNPRSLFVTLFVGILDLRDGVCRYVNAGHNPPVLLRAGGGAEVLRAISGPAAGVVEGFAYQTHEVRLADGDALALYTDGVTEALDPGKALYGEARLLEVLEAAGPCEPSALAHMVIEDVRRHAAGTEQSDDITLLAMRYGGASPA